MLGKKGANMKFIIETKKKRPSESYQREQWEARLTHIYEHRNKENHDFTLKTLLLLCCVVVLCCVVLCCVVKHKLWTELHIARSISSSGI
jgi:uncharacterized ion transporter superfamily protein YfcC